MNEQQLLRDIITYALGGPAGDPLDYSYKMAACAYLLMRDKGYEVPDEIELLATLRGDNDYNQNFLRLVTL